VAATAEADFVIVGAGSIGCVLANRLTADPNNRVLLQAGGMITAETGYLLPTSPDRRETRT